MKDLRKNLFIHTIKSDSTFVKENNAALEQTEERIANAKIVLRLLRYMRENGLKQKDLAEKLSVTPQYINKLLRGKDLNLSISTAIRYGITLGIKLISVDIDDPAPPKESVVHTGTTVTNFYGRVFKPTYYPHDIPLGSNKMILNKKNNSYEARTN